MLDKKDFERTEKKSGSYGENPAAAKLGDLGQNVVTRRLTKQGWRVLKPKYPYENSLVSLFDLRAIPPKKAKLSERLIEVKARQRFAFYSQGIKHTLKLPFARCDEYHTVMEKTHLPFDLYWVDFRNREVFVQDLQILLSTHEIDGVEYPRIFDKFENEPPSLLFHVKQFKLDSRVCDDDYMAFLRICKDYNIHADDTRENTSQTARNSFKADYRTTSNIIGDYEWDAISDKW